MGVKLIVLFLTKFHLIDKIYLKSIRRVVVKKYKVLQVNVEDAINYKENKLEESINTEAKDGWKVISCTPANISIKNMQINRFVVVLEKDE